MYVFFTYIVRYFTQNITKISLFVYQQAQYLLTFYEIPIHLNFNISHSPHFNFSHSPYAIAFRIFGASPELLALAGTFLDGAQVHRGATFRATRSAFSRCLLLEVTQSLVDLSCEQLLNALAENNDDTG